MTSSAEEAEESISWSISSPIGHTQTLTDTQTFSFTLIKCCEQENRIFANVQNVYDKHPRMLNVGHQSI